MKDSRLGTYGITGLVCLFLLEFYALSDIAKGEQNLLIIFVLAHCLSRWSSLPLIYFNPYVSRNSKSGKELTTHSINEYRLASASIFSLVLLFILGWGLVVSLLCGLVVILITTQYYYRKSIDSITGDWEKQTWADVYQQDPDFFNHWAQNWVTLAPPNGESFNDVISRCSDWYNEMSKSDDYAVIVAHGGSLRALLCIILGLPADFAFSFEFQHCHVSKIMINQGSAKAVYLNNPYFI